MLPSATGTLLLLTFSLDYFTSAPVLAALCPCFSFVAPWKVKFKVTQVKLQHVRNPSIFSKEFEHRKELRLSAGNTRSRGRGCCKTLVKIKLRTFSTQMFSWSTKGKISSGLKSVFSNFKFLRTKGKNQSFSILWSSVGKNTEIKTEIFIHLGFRLWILICLPAF